MIHINKLLKKNKKQKKIILLIIKKLLNKGYKKHQQINNLNINLKINNQN